MRAATAARLLRAACAAATVRMKSLARRFAARRMFSAAAAGGGTQTSGKVLRAPSEPARFRGTGSQRWAPRRRPALVQRRTRRDRLVEAAAAAESATDDAGAVAEESEANSTSRLGVVVAGRANFVHVRLEEGTSSTLAEGLEGLDEAEREDDTPLASRVRADAVELLCTKRSLLKKMRQTVLVGDRVDVGGIDWVQGRGVVNGVLPRRSQSVDPPVANADHMLLVFALARPDLDYAQLSRFLVAAEATGMDVSLALSKADLVNREEAEAARARVESWGYSTTVCSLNADDSDADMSAAGDDDGLTALGARLTGRTTVVAGPSGVGKSTMINTLWHCHMLAQAEKDAPAHEAAEVAGDATADADIEQPLSESGSRHASSPLPSVSVLEVADEDGNVSFAAASRAGLQATGSVSARSGKGKHTTRNISLIHLPGGGLLADTPGFIQPSVDNVSTADLPNLFPEIARCNDALGPCAFNNCTHVHEPGCNVRPPSSDAPLPEYDAELLRELAEGTSEGGGAGAGVSSQGGNDEALEVDAADPREWERYPLYVSLLSELEVVERKQRRQSREDTALKYKSRAGGVLAAEVRLEAKKHRRVSRGARHRQTLDAFDEAVDEVAANDEAERQARGGGRGGRGNGRRGRGRSRSRK